MATDFIKSAYGININVVRKSETPQSWQDHLDEFLIEAAKNIIIEASTSDLVNIINYIRHTLAYNRFNNSMQDDSIEAFRQKLFGLREFDICLRDGTCIKLGHLFPILLGRLIIQNRAAPLASMTAQKIEEIFYGSRKLAFSERDARDEKAKELQKNGYDYRKGREHDRSGDPIYTIEILSDFQEDGVLAKIANLFTRSLDFTFKLQAFYLNEKGIGKWLHSMNVALGKDAFENIRTITVLPGFNEIRSCFKRTPVELNEDLPGLDDQIHDLLESITEDEAKRDKALHEKIVDERFIRLQRTQLLDHKSRKVLIPIRNLFRINVYDYLFDVLKLSAMPIDKCTKKEGYECLDTKDLYWYCNNWLVREGLRTIMNNMQGDNKYFCILKPRDISKKSVVRYKIVLRDTGKGLSSVARAFGAGRGYFSKVGNYLEGFCELIVRSKVEGQEGVEYNVFWDPTDHSCTDIHETGTEFEITITQSRDR